MKHMRRIIKEGNESLNYRCTEAVEEAKDKILDWLGEMEGQTDYVGDIGMEITEDENRQGYWLVGTQKCIEKSIQNWGLSEYCVGYYKSEMDMDIGNDFWENPEKFWCLCMMALVERLWNEVANALGLEDDVEITKEFIASVEKALSKFTSISQLGME